MAEFGVSGPHRVPVCVGKAARTITPDEVKRFWTANPAAGTKRGCYIFAIQAGGGVTPMYVGRATRNFKQEVFTPPKLAKYQQALAGYLKGAPVLFFLPSAQGPGAPNRSAIAELEDHLIQSAVSVNPDLLNVHGTKRAALSITGVLRRGVGRPSKAARALKRCLGL